MGTGVGTHEVEHRLAEELDSITAARHLARAALQAWSYRGRHEDVLLVVSELVTNALLHGAGEPVLRMSGGRWHVRIEVADSSAEPPRPREPGPADGWGMHVVGKLSTGWGTSYREGGKVVWCELAAPLTALATGADGAADAGV